MVTEKIKIGDIEFELTGPEEYVARRAAELLKLVGSRIPAMPKNVASSSSSRAGESMARFWPRSHQTSSTSDRAALKRFAQDKVPKNTYEQIALVLYYSNAFDSKPERSTAEIMNLMSEAGFNRPKAAAQAISDARRKYRYVEAGTKRGLWRVSRQGRSLVDSLPRKEGG